MLEDWSSIWPPILDLAPRILNCEQQPIRIVQSAGSNEWNEIAMQQRHTLKHGTCESVCNQLARNRSKHQSTPSSGVGWRNANKDRANLQWRECVSMKWQSRPTTIAFIGTSTFLFARRPIQRGELKWTNHFVCWMFGLWLLNLSFVWRLTRDSGSFS